MIGFAFLLAASCAGNDAGDPSCPCLTEKAGSTALFVDISKKLASLGHSGAEGLRGCAAYPNISGSGNSSEMWCFVDPVSCAEDEEACNRAGGQLGSELYPEPCRSREMDGSSLISGVFLSYATCGNLSPRRYPTVALRNRTFKVVLDGKPYEEYPTTIQETTRKFHGLSGASIELWLDVIADRNINTIPFPRRNITKFLSPQAKAVSQSATTAAIYDIGVGRYDLAVNPSFATPGEAPSNHPPIPPRFALLDV
jgi:hypothetical protein